MQTKFTRYLPGHVAALTLPFMSLSCAAQEHYGAPGLSPFSRNAAGLFFELAPLETTHIGAFDVYARQVIGKSGGGGGGSGGGGNSGSWWDTVFPNGTPDDLKWTWLERPGFRLAAGYTLPGPARAPESSVEISAFVIHDENAMNVFAPTGLGIFYDPAKLRLRARFWGAGLNVMAPLGQVRLGSARLRFSAGAGAIAYVSRTTMKVNSAFLNLRFKKTRYRIRPLASAAMRMTWRAARTEKSAAPFSLSLRAEAFPTDHFWTVSLQFGMNWRF